jgi:hypothetical protein
MRGAREKLLIIPTLRTLSKMPSPRRRRKRRRKRKRAARRNRCVFTALLALCLTITENRSFI